MKTAVLNYALSAALPLTVLPLVLIAPQVIAPSGFLFLFLLTITYSSFRAGLKGGVIATLVSLSLAIGFLRYDPLYNNLTQTSELLAFLFASTLSSILIDSLINSPANKQAEGRLKETQRQLSELETKYAAAQQEIKSRDEFLSIASHELKTPLTSMLLQLQTILNSIKNVSLANFSIRNLLQMLESAEQQTNRLSRMINDLLNVSLITTGRMELEKEDVDLAQLTKDVASRFSEKLKQEAIQLNLEADKKVVGKWDKLRLEQAVSNLISNAIRYGDKKPITVNVSNSHSTAKVTVRDHGIGIPPEHQKKIFELFNRAIPSSNIKGLGVGLYITQQIARAHNGKIHLESKMGDGSSFTLELPQK